MPGQFQTNERSYIISLYSTNVSFFIIIGYSSFHFHLHVTNISSDKNLKRVMICYSLHVCDLPRSFQGHMPELFCFFCSHLFPHRRMNPPVDINTWDSWSDMISWCMYRVNYHAVLDQNASYMQYLTNNDNGQSIPGEYTYTFYSICIKWNYSRWRKQVFICNFEFVF